MFFQWEVFSGTTCGPLRPVVLSVAGIEHFTFEQVLECVEVSILCDPGHDHCSIVSTTPTVVDVWRGSSGTLIA